MANIKYNSAKVALSTGEIDWADAGINIKVMLVTSTYTPNQDTHTVKNHVTNEVVGTGYTAGGQLVIGRTTVQDNTSDLAKNDATGVTWTASSLTAKGAVIYKDTGDGATSPLLTYIDFGTDQTSVNADFKIQWNTGGVFTLS